MKHRMEENRGGTLIDLALDKGQQFTLNLGGKQVPVSLDCSAGLCVVTGPTNLLSAN